MLARPPVPDALNASVQISARDVLQCLKFISEPRSSNESECLAAARRVVVVASPVGRCWAFWLASWLLSIACAQCSLLQAHQAASRKLQAASLSSPIKERESDNRAGKTRFVLHVPASGHVRAADAWL